MRVIATAGHVDHGKSSLVHGPHRHRPRPLRRGEAPGADDRPRLRPRHRRRRGDQLRRRARATSGSCATCWPASAASTPACSSSPPPRAGSRRARSTCGSSSSSASATASSRSRRSTCSTTPTSSSWPRSRSPTTWPARSSPARRSCPSPRRSASASTTWPSALSDLARSTPASRDRGRARLWIDRVFSSKGSGTVVTGTLTDGAIAAGDPVVVEPGGRAAQGARRADDGHGRRRHRARATASRSTCPASSTRELARGDVVVAPGRWRTTERIDASLTVLASLDHVVSRRGAYLAYIGSGEHAVRLRVLGPESLLPGETGAVRLHLPVALPLLPGDRYVLRESGRDETVGGGEVLDVAPVVPASRARPDRDVDRVIAERGWVDVDELELLTGERRAPTVGRWVAPADVVTSAAVDLADRLDAAGAARPRRLHARRAPTGRAGHARRRRRRRRQRPPRRPGRSARRAPRRRRAGGRGAGARRARRHRAGRAARAGPAGRASSNGTGCGSTPTP